MSDVVFSIIIPAYNVEKYIGRTLLSFVDQSFNDFEVIVVNDGSTDKTTEIVESFANKFIHFKLLTQKNQGVSIARNNGIDKSMGKYIIFFDGDDFVEPDFLLELNNLLVYDKNPDVVFCGFDKVDSDNNRIDLSDAVKKEPIYMDKNHILKRFLENNMLIWTGCAAYRKSLLINNQIYFNKRFRHGEDQDFTIRALYCAEKIGFTNKVLAHYLQRQGSAVNSANPFKIRDDIKVYAALKRYFEKKNEPEILNIILKFKLPYNIYTVIKILARNGNYSEYRRLLNKKVYRLYLYKALTANHIKCATKIYILLLLILPKFIFNKFKKV